MASIVSIDLKVSCPKYNYLIKPFPIECYSDPSGQRYYYVNPLGCDHADASEMCKKCIGEIMHFVMSPNPDFDQVFSFPSPESQT